MEHLTNRRTTCEAREHACVPVSRREEEGFTLVELLVALGIFMVVMTVSTAIFTAVVRANRQAEAKHHALMSFGVAMESMMRTIEFGTDYSISGGNTIHVNDINDRDVWYRCTSCTGTGTGLLERQVGTGPWVRYTSNVIDIDSFLFRVENIGSDELQPVVTVAVEGNVDIGARQGTVSTPFRMQFTTSQVSLEN